MNLDELQSVQARERQSSDLQHLRSSFYQEVGEFIQELTDERARAVERADDPFSSAEVRQLTDDIETAEQTVEAIYERRVGKVVKKASIAAAGMPVDADGLTREEEALFEDLVARIESNRETVLSVLDGDNPSVSVDDAPDAATDVDSPTATESSPSEPRDEAAPSDATPDTDGVSAADLMGSGSEADANAETDAPTGESGTSEPDAPSEDPLAADTAREGEPTEVPPEPAPPGTGADDGSDPERAPGTTDEATGGDDDREVPGIPRTTVRITADVGEMVGADDRDYDLGPEDVVTLPEPNAEVLVEKDAAERLE